MKNRIIFLIIVIVSCSNKIGNQPLVIKPLFPYIQELDISDEKGRNTIKNKYYFVDNYQEYSKDSSFFDKFILDSIKLEDLSRWNNFNVFFYKKSKIINENTKSIIKDDYINVIVQKPILRYSWLKGKFDGCFVFSEDNKEKVFRKYGNLLFYSLNEEKQHSDSFETEVSIDTTGLK